MSATLSYPVFKRVGRVLPIFACPFIVEAHRSTLSSTMTIPALLRGPLCDAISSGTFIDTQIILFSRRDSSGKVCKPKALYANSHALKAVPYFNDRKFLLHPTYCVCNDRCPGVLSGPFSESEIKDFSDVVDNGEFAEDYGYSSDSDLEDDRDFESPAPPPCLSQPPKQDPLYGEYKEHVRTGKVIRIQDVAFITCVLSKSIYTLTFSAGKSFQAFLLYLYTQSIRFAPFGSEENRKSRGSEIVWAKEGEIPRPSPKSIYRLADKVTKPSHCSWF